MDTKKTIQFVIRLMELTSEKQIEWKLISDSRQDDDFDELHLESNPLLRQLQHVQEWSRSVSQQYQEMLYKVSPFTVRVYEAELENKIIRLIGKEIEGKNKCAARLQLWNDNKDKLIYQFPSIKAIEDLFSLVSGFDTQEADQFVDNLLAGAAH